MFSEAVRNLPWQKTSFRAFGTHQFCHAAANLACIPCEKRKAPAFRFSHGFFR